MHIEGKRLNMPTPRSGGEACSAAAPHATCGKRLNMPASRHGVKQRGSLHMWGLAVCMGYCKMKKTMVLKPTDV